MGAFTFEVSGEFVGKLRRLGDVDTYAKQMLNEAAPILQKSVKAQLTRVTSNESTGELVASVKYNKANKSPYGGYYLQVRPTGNSSRKGDGYLRKGKHKGNRKISGGVRDPVRNMEKAVFLEYGTSRGQLPRPWVYKALTDAEPAVLDKMQSVFNREMGE